MREQHFFTVVLALYLPLGTENVRCKQISEHIREMTAVTSPLQRVGPKAKVVKC